MGCVEVARTVRCGGSLRALRADGTCNARAAAARGARLAPGSVNELGNLLVMQGLALIESSFMADRGFKQREALSHREAHVRDEESLEHRDGLSQRKPLDSLTVAHSRARARQGETGWHSRGRGFDSHRLHSLLLHPACPPREWLPGAPRAGHAGACSLRAARWARAVLAPALVPHTLRRCTARAPSRCLR